MKYYLQIIIILLLFSSISCSNSNNIFYQNDNIKKTKKEHSQNFSQKDTTIFLKVNDSCTCKIDIKYPENLTKSSACIMMLHGFGHSSEEWCNNSIFCSEALKQNYVLIIPDFGYTNYSLAIYPETTEKYRKYPTVTWIINKMIPYIQNNFNLLGKNSFNCICGISTGARGATLLSYYLPDIFKAAASISGDFDITKIPDDNIYTSFFGDYNKFQKRWQKESLASKYKKYKTCTYIAHGLADETSPAQQSIEMYNILKKTHPESFFVSHFVENAKHDYKYWDTETENILDFFNICSKKVKL